MIIKKKKLLILFLFAFLLRVAYVLFYPQYPVLMDAKSYTTLAINLSEGKGYTHDGTVIYTRRPPGYPFFLASIFSLFGKNLIIARLSQAFISSMIVVFVYLIAKMVFNKKIAYMSALLYAGYFPSIFYSGLLLTETLYSFLLIITFYFLLLKNQSKSFTIIIGIFFGVIALVRSTSILLPFFTLLLFFIFNRKKKCIINFVLIIIFMFLVILPWSLINYGLYNRFFLINTAFGLEIWTTTHPADLHYNGNITKEIAKLAPKMINMNPIEQSDFFFAEAKKNLLNYPLAYVKITLKRITYRLWLSSHTNNVIGLNSSFSETIRNKELFVFLSKAFFLLVNTIIILLGFLGILLFLKNNKFNLINKILLTSPVFYKILLHGFGYAASRYSVPIMPFMIIFSAYGIAYLYSLKKIRLLPVYFFFLPKIQFIQSKPFMFK